MTISTWAPEGVIIASITNDSPALVTTTTDHGYQSGLFIRFVFSPLCGMTQLIGTTINNVYLITVKSPTTFTIPVDTTLFGPFNDSGSSTQPPQIIPVGEIATSLLNLERNTLTPIGG